MKPNLASLARKAATAAAKAADANRAWRDAFKSKYGHDDISDVLVEAIDYSHGDVSMITKAFIEENSGPGNS